MPDHIHQIRSIRPVEDRERRLEADAVGILPQDSSADSMEGASPRQVDLTYAHGCTAFRLGIRPKPTVGKSPKFSCCKI
jgi:hypothetical protein